MKNLLNKWLGGSTTWEEEKQLRRAAEQDDFLAEAMEGYDAFPNSNHTASIDRLNTRLPKRKQQNRGLIGSLPRIAAAAAVIGLIGTLFWVQQRVQSPSILSQNSTKTTAPNPIEEKEVAPQLSLETTAEEIMAAAEQAPPPPPIVKKDIKVNTPTKPVKKKKNTPKPVIVPEPEPIAYAQEESATADVVAVEEISAAPAPIIENDAIIARDMALEERKKEAAREGKKVRAGKEVEMARTAKFKNAPVTASSTAPAQSANSKLETLPVKLNYYVGQVQNEDGQPLNDVKIIGVNTPFNTISELNGDFRLETDIPLTKIAVSKDGFHTRKIALNQYSDFLNVSLNRKTTVVPGEEELVTLAPKPVNGFVDFFNYLAKNKVYPKGAKDKGIEREVEVRFYIDENGRPTNLKITNPDIYGFDKEAIRLLENGPNWQPTNSHARYYVPFEK